MVSRNGRIKGRVNTFRGNGKEVKISEMGNMWQILKDKGIEKAKRNC
jgi:hypothetical protein